MKKKAFFVILFLAVAVLNAYAHPPSDIKITFDSQTRMVTAVIMHDVKDPAKHFIKKVDVGLNGKVIISHTISHQDNSSSQTVTYLVPDAQKGDLLSITGYCSIIGNLEKELRI